MYTKSLITACLALSVTAAPVAAPQPQLLSDLSPDVVQLLNGLGLVSISAPVGGVVNDLSDGLKKRQLLSDLAPDVGALVSGLGLPNVGVPVAGVLESASNGLKKRQAVPDLSAGGAGAVPNLLTELLGEGGTVPGLLEGLLGSGTTSVQKRQLLADLSPDVSALLAGLGLASLSPGVGGVVNDLSNGL